MTEPSIAARQTSTLARLRRRLGPIEPLKEVEVRLPRGGQVFTILQPDYIDLLLDAFEDDPEQNLPYWAEIWPSGVALADAIMLEPEMVRGRRVLEIGSGIGVTASAALAQGAELIAADYFAEALTLCRYNTLRNTGREPRTIQVNWREPAAALYALAGDGFPVVLAADILYEERDVEPLLRLFERVVAPGGLLWLADPLRRPADRFIEAAAAPGWRGTPDYVRGPWPEPREADVVVRIHRLTRRG